VVGLGRPRCRRHAPGHRRKPLHAQSPALDTQSGALLRHPDILGFAIFCRLGLALIPRSGRAWR
jgi:hypothetical protein